MDIKRVTVLGAGNGGITAAADLTLRGFEVALFELPQFSRNIDLLNEKGGRVTLKEPDGGLAEATISLLTTDIKKALADAQLVLVTIPSIWTEELKSAHRILKPNNSSFFTPPRACARCVCKHRKTDRRYDGFHDRRICHLGLWNASLP